MFTPERRPESHRTNSLATLLPSPTQKLKRSSSLVGTLWSNVEACFTICYRLSRHTSLYRTLLHLHGQGLSGSSITNTSIISCSSYIFSSTRSFFLVRRRTKPNTFTFHSSFFLFSSKLTFILHSTETSKFGISTSARLAKVILYPDNV